LILSIQGRNREKQPSRRRTQEPIATRDRCRDGGGEGTEIRERSVEQVEKNRKGMGGGNFVKRERETGRRVGVVTGDERMDVREEAGWEREKFC
jgi:hypothetical protein